MDRPTLAATIDRLIGLAQRRTDTAAARTQVATAAQLLQPVRLRGHAKAVSESITQLRADLADLDDLVAYYALLYPEAHDDDPAKPGKCLCKRPADTCPARAAARAGVLTWKDELGREHPLNDPGNQLIPGLI